MALKKLTLVLGLAITALAFHHPALAQIGSVSMQVDGMTCPFCVYGIEKKLKALAEVEDVGTNLKTGVVDITLTESAPIDIERLDGAVRESGFTPGKVKIEAAGKLREYKAGGEKHPALEVTGSGQVFLLTSTRDHENQEFLGEKKLNEIEKAASGGDGTIAVTGYVHAHPDGIPPALSVESFETR